ncbi:hypothetical protein, partial [Pseudooceanicola marinus]|uniref:hypothetical protein n=1 Tax=Pseudooceanicola marinus TaxID=396013 RepID=UPI001F36411D
DQTVDQLVPVDAVTPRLIALVSLELPADAMPATGIQPVWGHHKINYLREILFRRFDLFRRCFDGRFTACS